MLWMQLHIFGGAVLLGTLAGRRVLIGAGSVVTRIGLLRLSPGLQ